MECSCRLCPTPGMYAVTSIWLVNRTRATFRSAEFGFLGVVVYTRVHTPRRCGLPFSAGVLVLLVFAWRPLRTNCWMVGIRAFVSLRPPAVTALSVFVPRPTPAPAVGRVAPASVARPFSRLARSGQFPRGATRRTHDEPGRARARGERVPTVSAQVKTEGLRQGYPQCPGSVPRYPRSRGSAASPPPTPRSLPARGPG